MHVRVKVIRIAWEWKMERTNSRQPQCAMNITFNPHEQKKNRELNEHWAPPKHKHERSNSNRASGRKKWVNGVTAKVPHLNVLFHHSFIKCAIISIFNHLSPSNVRARSLGFRCVSTVVFHISCLQQAFHSSAQGLDGWLLRIQALRRSYLFQWSVAIKRKYLSNFYHTKKKLATSEARKEPLHHKHR